MAGTRDLGGRPVEDRAVRSPDSGRRVSVRAGNHQSTRVGEPFRAQLSALVVDAAGYPAARVRVTFRVTSGSALFGHGARAATSTTGPSGVATAQVLAAGPMTGGVQVTATVGSALRPASFTLRVIPASLGRPTLRR